MPIIIFYERYGIILILMNIFNICNNVMYIMLLNEIIWWK